MSAVWRAEDVGATFGGLASDAAAQVINSAPDWFPAQGEAAVWVERYTSAAVWALAQGSAGFHALKTPDPAACMKAFHINRLTRFGSAAAQRDDKAIWRMLQEDAEAFAGVMMAPQTQSSAEPLERIANIWFLERSGPYVFDRFPNVTAQALVMAAGHLYSGVEQVVAKVGGR